MIPCWPVNVFAGPTGSTTKSAPAAGDLRGRLCDALAYSAAILASLVASYSVLRLRHADFSVPFRGQWDALFYSAWIKNIVENHAYYINTRIGAPGRLELYDFPLPHATHWIFLRLLGLCNRNYAWVMNAYYLLTFPLTTVTSLFTLRKLRVGRVPAVTAGVLFAFLPYHLIRGESHLTYSSYYLVPLVVLSAIWLCSGESLYRCDFDRSAPERKWITRNGVISLAVCLLVAGDTPYNAFFATFFLMVAASVAALRYGPRRLLSGALLLLTLLLAFAANLAPTARYQHVHGKNREPVFRLVGESEVYGLKLAQLVLPSPGHRVSWLAVVTQRYYRSAPLVNENGFATLGLTATCGFLLLLAWLVLRSGPPVVLLDVLSRLNVAGFLLGTIGGIGVLFALLVSPDIRGYNRICVFLAFFSLTAAAYLLDAWAKSCKTQLGRAMVYACVMLLLPIGLLDQTTRADVPDHRALQRQAAGDREFVNRIEAVVPANGMVFQLPYVAFPASAPVHRMYDYDHFRAYLNSHHVRWSYGAMRGRATDKWQKAVAALPTPEFLNCLQQAGFSGVYVNRQGYADQALKVRQQLVERLGEPIVSNDRHLLFFALRQNGQTACTFPWKGQ
jgi:phosphoglycerol transferase